mmetsp:Transcript_12102/g.32441  ORF Transcript_12102/g.32441 Transcript_12102/m.32441 type:complete len:92 (+) Transcript_12102:1348-1623(+)
MREEIESTGKTQKVGDLCEVGRKTRQRAGTGSERGLGTRPSRGRRAVRPMAGVTAEEVEHHNDILSRRKRGPNLLTRLHLGLLAKKSELEM